MKPTAIYPPSPQTQQQPKQQQPKPPSPRTQQQELMKQIKKASPEERKMVVDFLHKWLTRDDKNEIMSSRYPEEPVMLTHNWGSPPPSTPFQKQKTGGQTQQSRQKQQQKKAP